MCGIAGYINYSGEGADKAVLKAMSDAIAHRGPDGEGQVVEGACGLAHRRLAILDLSDASLQPIVSADGRHVMVYNGELYNFAEIRAELEAKGHVFRTTGDTEVVLEAIAEWGLAGAVPRFNGMFAIAAWDRKENVLHLARDRYGIKPLYYVNNDRLFAFGSEIKAILAGGHLKGDLCAEGLVEYLTFQNFFTDRTIFRDVRMLPAGSVMTVRAGGGKPSVRRYWDYCFEEPETARSEDDYLEELDHLFRQAVTRQLVADVDVGSYLSGGMDSGSITAIAAKTLPYMRTFTVGFDLHSASGVELAFDERRAAELMSYKFKTEHYEMVLKAGDMERAMPRLARHLEEPRVGQSYPNFYAAQLASKFVKVVLSGAGGDEIFAGYPWRYYRAVVNSDFDDYVGKYYGFWQRLLDKDQLRGVLDPVWDDVKHVSPVDIFRDVFANRPNELDSPEDYINQSLYFEARTFLHGLLVVEDKLSMAHSLETRVPFLDNDLVDFAMRLPTHMKLGNLTEVVREDENQLGKARKHFQKTKDGKLILRKLMSRYIPDEVANAVKQGFSAPDASWFKGESIDYVNRVVDDPKSRIYEFMDAKSVHALVDAHMSGAENKRLLIWSLLSLESWMDEFVHPPAG
ncbi:asparagine synthase (glutamine-hydrolyzing) [Hyphobacterium marinum]|uniref:asparagine synthase (glutamine-hydrolyzing) n=1 Tax=Hyphobacterium marinum TaxID=3116574 RepID=A0ABU7LY56_9PROT|nr:asparagine synthase (glutamine-hydrolyzing) [Hyphobacterium sp. Y6023]MEE2566478.1 asparagine synthase (glutamine-hydrolyzing) [Hyphobacterium sp. Y6023]